METCKEIDETDELLILEDLISFDCIHEKYQDLQDKYSSLHETYTKEIENSKKVKKSLEKCLKFYSKLCKKYEAQQKVIEDLERSNKEKMTCLEDSFRNQEKMKGLIEIYKSERSQIESNFNLQRDKEILLDICCKLISESEKTDNIKKHINLIIKKFRNDLNEEKLNLLRGSQIHLKGGTCKIKDTTFDSISYYSSVLNKNLLSKSLIDEEDTCKVKVEKPPFTELDSKTEIKNDFKANSDLPIINQISQKLIATDLISSNETSVPKESFKFDQVILDKSEAKSDLNIFCAKDENLFVIKELNEQEEVDKYDKKRESSFRNEEVTNSLPLLNDNVQLISDLSDSESIETEQGDQWLVNHSKLNKNDNIMQQDTAVKLFNSTSMETHENLKSNEINSDVNEVKNELHNTFTSVGICNSEKRQLNKFLKDGEISNNCQEIFSTGRIEKKILHTSSEVCKPPKSNASQITFTEEISDLPVISEKSNIQNIKSRSKLSQFVENDKKKDHSDEFNDSIPLNSDTDKCIIKSSKCVKLYCKESESNRSDEQYLSMSNKSIFDVPEAESSNQYSSEVFHNLKQPPSLEAVIQDHNDEMKNNGDLKTDKKVQDSTKITSKKIIVSKEISSGKKIANDGNYFSEISKESGLSLEGKSPVKMEVTDDELRRIFSEMSGVRLLSPIRDLDANHLLSSKTEADFYALNCKNSKILPFVESSISEFYKNSESIIAMDSEKKREPSPGVFTKNKKLKSEETCQKKNDEKGPCDFLDSIMSAMSNQNKEFKSNVFNNLPTEESEKALLDCDSFGNKFLTSSNKLNSVNGLEVKTEKIGHVPIKKFSQSEIIKKNKDKSSAIEKLVKEKIQKFVSSTFSSEEEADKGVKECISVLTNKCDDVIAGAIVGIVLENVNEKVEIFERPVPPLTKTQNQLIILLSVFKAQVQEARIDNIIFIILNKISRKLFPDNFFWPDDAVEMACRFYAALCKHRNDPHCLLKFCLQAMTEMKQRSCMVVFVALKTWPDILHNASTLKHNILALTMVNIFLHMPNKNLNANQKKKLLALKHLLTKYYGFQVDDTIENFTNKIWTLLLKDEMSADRSFVLLARCRDVTWTKKNIFSKLLSTLKEKSESDFDSVGQKILHLIKQLITGLPKNNENSTSEGLPQEIISVLSEILLSKKVTHELEIKIVEILLNMKQHQSARHLIREWIPKGPISVQLRNEMANVSAENILQELRFNPKNGGFEKKNYEKLKKKKKAGGKKGRKKKEKFKFDNKKRKAETVSS